MALALATIIVIAAAYGAAKIFPKSFDTATAAEPKISANPPPVSPIVQAQIAPQTT
jgi:hypothetical protein